MFINKFTHQQFPFLRIQSLYETMVHLLTLHSWIYQICSVQLLLIIRDLHSNASAAINNEILFKFIVCTKFNNLIFFVFLACIGCLLSELLAWNDWLAFFIYFYQLKDNIHRLFHLYLPILQLVIYNIENVQYYLYVTSYSSF